MKVDLAAPLAPGADGDVRRRVALPRSPSTAPTAWAATARCTSSRSGIRASACTTTCAAGTPSRISARASSISSTATTTSTSPCRRATSSPRTGALQNAQRGAHARADHAPRAGGEVATRRCTSSPQDELKSGAARPTKTGTMTWRFAAKNVRDAVWAGVARLHVGRSRAGRASWRMAYYRPTRGRPVEGRGRQARMSIMEYSERWFQYPWPQISAVEGPISGMEYPMLAMETKSDDKYDLYNVVTHEIGHMWYPMIVGSNERVHMWQDEGFNTFINTSPKARRYPEKGDQMARALDDRAAGRAVHAARPRRAARDRRPTASTRGCSAIERLREDGGRAAAAAPRDPRAPRRSTTRSASTSRRWAFKHPTPADFFRTMEDVGGRAARLVLARVVPREPALRPGDRHGGRARRPATASTSR